MDVNGGRWGRGCPLDEDCLAGKFVLIQKSERPKNGLLFERMTNGVCILYAWHRRKDEAGGWTCGG